MPFELITVILATAPTSAAEWAILIGALAAAIVIGGVAIWTIVKLLKDGKINQLKDAIVAAVKEAEKTHRSGAEKKEIAVKTAKEFCDGIGLKVDERLLKWIADYIDKYIADHNELEEIEEMEGKE